MQNLNELSVQAHENARKHGFWDNNPTPEHCLMLVITEIGEMVEADRKDRLCIFNRIKKEANLAAAQKISYRELVDNAPDFNEAFGEIVKDTVEDEMADVAIRLLDLAGHLGMDFTKLSEMRYHRAFDHFSFTENAFALCKGLTRDNINVFKRIQFGLHYISKWARSRRVNLAWHVERKMKFNESRSIKHGKKY